MGEVDFSNVVKSKQKKKRNFWYTLVKVCLIIILATIVINVLLFTACYINHKSKLSKEEKYLVEPGNMYEVDGHYMHVYVGGNKDSDVTLLFMHNNRDSDACIELYPLYEYLDDYKIVYVDRSGNGYSEVSGKDRDIDTMLEETRSVIEAAGINEQVVLVPNGTAGIEAIYWAEKYPDQVAGVIGISMSYPDLDKDNKLPDGYERFGKTLCFFNNIGGHRFLGATYPNNDADLYTKKQMTVSKALISRRYYTKDMYNEELMYYKNAKTVAEYGEFPTDIPMLMVLSNPLLDPYFSSDENIQKNYQSVIDEYDGDVDVKKEYNKSNLEYFDKFDNVKCQEMSGPVTLFTFDPEKLASYMKDFLNSNYKTESVE